MDGQSEHLEAVCSGLASGTCGSQVAPDTGPLRDDRVAVLLFGTSRRLYDQWKLSWRSRRPPSVASWCW